MLDEPYLIVLSEAYQKQIVCSFTVTVSDAYACAAGRRGAAGFR